VHPARPLGLCQHHSKLPDALGPQAGQAAPLCHPCPVNQALQGGLVGVHCRNGKGVRVQDVGEAGAVHGCGGCRVPRCKGRGGAAC